MAADERAYSDEEFARILRAASEMAGQAEQPAGSGHGLTLTEITAAAAQAGFDPVLVERAARMQVSQRPGSPLERIVGGPFQHEQRVHISMVLDEQSAARLLSAVRISAAHYRSDDTGHSSALGVTWTAAGAGDTVSVAARPEGQGTSVSIVVDRRGTLVLVSVISGLAVVVSFIAGVGMQDAIPMLAPWIPAVGTLGTLAAARRFWTSSTRTVRERVGALLQSIDDTFSRE